METVKHTLAFKAIVACDIYGTIGDGVRMPWDSLQGDLPRFKALTTGKAVVMGRNTFESLPMFPKGLPGRTNYILSRKHAKYEAISIVEPYPTSVFLPLVKTVPSDSVLIYGDAGFLVTDLAQHVVDGKVDPDIWIIGGPSVWDRLANCRQMAPLITRGLGTDTPVTHRVLYTGIDEIHLSLVHIPQRGSVHVTGFIGTLRKALIGEDGWIIISQEDYLQSNPPYTYYHLKRKDN